MSPADATGAASITAATLTAVGLSPHLAAVGGSIVGVGMLVVFAMSQAMPWLPVPTATSPAWYSIPYGVFARATGSWRNNAPMPATPSAPAGGIVPVPPPLKKD